MLQQRFKISLVVAAALSTAGCATISPPPHTRSALRLTSVAISVPDLAEAITWYRDFLGLTEGRHLDFRDLGIRMASLYAEGVHVELVETRGSRSRHDLLPEATNPALVQGFGKIGFLVEDVDGWASRLRARGAKFQVDIRDDQVTQSRTFIVLDNNGNWLQFAKPLKQER